MNSSPCKAATDPAPRDSAPPEIDAGPGVMRLLVDPPLDGPTNMARDEALLQGVSEGTSPPTLRFYAWSTPTVSLGYFQPYEDFQRLGPPISRLPIVRRPTGGGAILHDQELTYSLALPLDHPLLACGPNSLYEFAHDAVIDSLRGLGVVAWRGADTDNSGPTRGPFFCFARRHRYDVLVGRDKIAGSAQRRTRTALLQHGSVILGNRFADQPVAAILPISVDEAAARLQAAWVKALFQSRGIVARASAWSRRETDFERSLLSKHSDQAWLFRA